MENPTTGVPSESRDTTATAAEIDDEVTELLTDMIALLCNAETTEVKVRPVRGDKTVLFVVDFDSVSPNKSRYRGMVIGREGGTIMAIRRYLKVVGGAYRRYYDIDLVEDKEHQKQQHRPDRNPAPG